MSKIPSASEMLLPSDQDTFGPLPAHTQSDDEDKRNPHTRRFYKPVNRNNDPVKKSFNMERSWQKLHHNKLRAEIAYGEKLILSRRVAGKKKDFLENPFYFADQSNDLENNGFGDHYLYGIYAGWPQVLMMDVQSYFTNRKEFLDKSVRRILSHKTSLLSSASTTQIVGRVAKEGLSATVLSLLRPKDPQVMDRLVERHRSCLTKKRNRNMDSFKPYVANVNLPKYYPIQLNIVEPFPKGTLKEVGLKQHRKRLKMKPPKEVTFIPKVRLRHAEEKIFPWRFKTPIKDDESKDGEENKPVFSRILQNVVAEEMKPTINRMKEDKQRFLDIKRIPLLNYQEQTSYVEPKKKYEGFYDHQPKIETPWLTKMIDTGRFTRKDFLQKFMDVKELDSPGKFIRFN